MFESVRNYYEEAVFHEVTERAPEFPALANNPELLGDVACVALNRITPRYIRNQVDMTFYLDAKERLRNQALVKSAVAAAFRFVDTQRAAGERG
jgi:hypothetical protein